MLRELIVVFDCQLRYFDIKSPCCALLKDLPTEMVRFMFKVDRTIQWSLTYPDLTYPEYSLIQIIHLTRLFTYPDTCLGTN